jgi:rare lipoprotein A
MRRARVRFLRRLRLLYRPAVLLFPAFCAALAVAAGGCATSAPKPSRPSSPPASSSSRPPAGGPGQLGEPVWIETGVASWYGGNDGFEGKPTASGEIYDSSRLTAAHRQLPLGTIVDVQNVENSRTVRVRINDRGPFVKGRVIDLSRAAASEIGVLGPGTANVRIALITRAADREPVSPPGGWAVQVGSFGEAERALRHAERVRATGLAVYLQPFGGLSRVKVGPFDSRRKAEETLASLESKGFEGIVTSAK